MTDKKKVVCPECGATLICRSSFITVAEHRLDEYGNVVDYNPDAEPDDGFGGSDWQCSKDMSHNLRDIREELREIEENLF